MSAIEVTSFQVPMRDGVRLATDLYRPPLDVAPCIAARTPYGRMGDKLVTAALALARCGYAVLLQDCRGTGGSEPEAWDYYVYESEDGPDLVDWIREQPWWDGFLGGIGGSYLGQTQWGMATHPAMGAIAPEMSGLGVWAGSANLHMFVNSYARSVGKGAGKLAIPHQELERLMLQETLAGGWFAAPMEPPFSDALLRHYPDFAALPWREAQRALWQRYCTLPSPERAAFIRTARDGDAVTIADIEAMPSIFGRDIAHDAHTLPSPDPASLAQAIEAPALMVTGWYDWGLPDALATWQLLGEAGKERIATDSRLVITPSAHGDTGYREGMADHPALQHSWRTQNILPLLLAWYDACRAGHISEWPKVSYWLMGANEWRTAPDWPPPGVRYQPYYLLSDGRLGASPRDIEAGADYYVYDPLDPTPTIGGSILSSVYPAGSVDISAAQTRDDVLVYSSPALEAPLTVAGPLRAQLYVSSSAPDTDFVVRLSDVFPDGRAIQLQSGILRARHRIDPPAPLEPGQVHCIEIDIWATANQFAAGHRIRIDISSADFPRFDRHSNRIGAGDPIVAKQTVHRSRDCPSHVLLPVLPNEGGPA